MSERVVMFDSSAVLAIFKEEPGHRQFWRSMFSRLAKAIGVLPTAHSFISARAVTPRLSTTAIA
jgi:hypothetical protein